jgi:hypothetical protein
VNAEFIGNLPARSNFVSSMMQLRGDASDH